LCINTEAGQIFYFTRAEKARILQIVIEEAGGKVPIFAGTWALTTEETGWSSFNMSRTWAGCTSVIRRLIPNPVMRLPMPRRG
jgi:hypothetical protein